MGQGGGGGGGFESSREQGAALWPTRRHTKFCRGSRCHSGSPATSLSPCPSLPLSVARGLWLVKFYAFLAPVCCKMKIVTPRRSRSSSRSQSRSRSQRSIQDESSGNDDKDDDVACQTWHPLRGCCCCCGCCFVFGFYDFGGIYFT